MDGLPLTYKFAQTSDGDPRTGTFPQTLVTVGDTACSVKGVLGLSGYCFHLRCPDEQVG